MSLFSEIVKYRGKYKNENGDMVEIFTVPDNKSPFEDGLRIFDNINCNILENKIVCNHCRLCYIYN